jgi:Anti-sigma-28 factor, FlgM
MENESAGADAPDQVMEENQAEKMAGIKERVERGDYSVDPAAVADAILRRIGFPHPAPDTWRSTQKECSYPDSCSPDGPKLTPASPRRTEPIQVRSTVPPSFRSVVSGLRSAAGGMQTQIS